jgi:hypothetical protein
MKATLTVIKAFSNQIGNYLGSTERAISKALKEADMLAKCDKDRTTVKITAEGRRHNLLCLPLRLVIDWDDEIIKDINPEMPF